MTHRAGVAIASTLLALGGCSSSTPSPEPTTAGTQIQSDFTGEGFYDAPFPSDHRLVAGSVTMAGFPNPADIPFVSGLVELIDGRAEGFGTTSGIYFSLDAPIDEASLPTLEQSVQDDAALFLIAIDPEAPDYLQRHPIHAFFEEDGGPFGASNLLSLVPLQGVPLRATSRYAAVATTALVDTHGEALVPSALVRDLAAGRPVAGLEGDARHSYDQAVTALDALGVSLDTVAGLTAFTTWDGTQGMQALVDEARTLPVPSPQSAWERTDVFDGYCVYESTLEMPVYQAGEPPYYDVGGGIAFEDGVPTFDRNEVARIVVTVPRATMPLDGWPVAVMVRTGGGGDRPLVDRGVRDETGEVAIPGSGPAMYFAEAGFAGVSVDGPHGGIRNVTGGDEQFLIFNISNPTAMRDNIRQSALELALLPDVLSALELDLTVAGQACPDADPTARFDLDTLAIMGHSMGATISPLTLAVEPRYRAAILSGAGGSWIENVVHKQSPVAVRPLAEVLLQYVGIQRKLHEHDPALSLLQWAGEPADPPIYAAASRTGAVVAAPPPHVVMLQGIVDTYILPPIANATSLSFGLDLGGEPLDATHPDLVDFTPLETLLPHVGRDAVPLPIGGNRDGTTLVVVQHAEGPIEDGHEVVFQTEGPKHQYRCFLDSFRTGAPPTVPAAGGLSSPCDD